LIEVDGIYWHARNENNRPKYWKKIKNNDEYKNKLAKDREFKLVRIWEDEIHKKWRFC